MCSRLRPPSSGGAPSSVGPNTIDKLDTDIWLVESLLLTLSEASARINTLISRYRAREASTALLRGHTRQKDAAPVQMAHEKLERRVVRIRQLVDLFMKPDMPQSVVLVP